jgi:hypothetical protein
MTSDDIIRMAHEANLHVIDEEDAAFLEAFAALIREHLLSTEIHSCHADCQRFACVQTRKAVEAEREAILQMSQSQWFKTQADFEAAIRARGQH